MGSAAIVLCAYRVPIYFTFAARMFKHSAIYLLARGFPALASLLAIVLYTRLLSAAEYGQYTLVLSAAGLGEAALFHWLSVSLLRFYPSMPTRVETLLATVKRGFIAPTLVTIALTAVAGVFWRTQLSFELLGLAALLTVALALFNLVLTYWNARLAPVRYGLLAGLKAWLALAIGALFVYWGFGASGPLIGLIAAITLTVLSFVHPNRDWRTAMLRKANPALLGDLKHYGYPLAITVALNYVIGYSDRFVIGWLLGVQETGLYAAGYDLTQQALGVLMIAVNLAAVPLVIHALESQGPEAARQQLAKHATLLLAVAIPSVSGFVVLAPNIAHVLLGQEYRSTGATLMPWIAGAAFLFGLKAYYFDLAFQLGRRTTGQIGIAVIVAGVNLLLNIWLLPLLGLIGAAYAYGASSVLACMLSALIGARIFQLPSLPGVSWKFLVAALVMAGVLCPMRNYVGPLALCGQIIVGILAYLGALFLSRGVPCRLLRIGPRRK